MLNLNYLPGLVLALFAVVSATFIPCCLECSADETEPWSYRGLQNGPSQWPRLFPRDCSGRSQSPINIDTKLAKVDKSLPPLVLKNYNVSIPKATMVNEDGHTVQIMPDDNVRRTIVVNGSEYVLNQFHFHWGLSAFKGSEHTIDNKAFTMEVHFVHSTTDGRVAVVAGLFVEIYNNPGLQPIVDSLEDVMYKDDRTSLKSPLKLSDFIPIKPPCYYRYSGSLTTPNCTEGVIWTVICEPMPVGQSQMRIFRSMLSVTEEEASEDGNEDCLIAPNYRPTQPLNGRQVYFSPRKVP